MSGKVLRNKLAVLLDFVQMRGGRALPNFFVQFSRIYWVNLGMGREGETPAQIFWHKKVVQVVQIRGRGGESS